MQAYMKKRALLRSFLPISVNFYTLFILIIFVAFTIELSAISHVKITSVAVIRLTVDLFDA